MQASKKLFLGITGSVASIKLPELLFEADNQGFETVWHPTESAKQFVCKAIIRVLGLMPNSPPLSNAISQTREAAERLTKKEFVEIRPLLDQALACIDETSQHFPHKAIKLMNHGYEDGVDTQGVMREDKGYVKHINLAEQSDIALIAPTTANTLAKIVHGQTDNFLTEVVRALPPEKQIHLALAMNTEMLKDPATQRNLSIAQSEAFGFNQKYHVIAPISKELQCGTTGLGAMEDPHKIFQIIS